MNIRFLLVTIVLSILISYTFVVIFLMFGPVYLWGKLAIHRTVELTATVLIFILPLMLVARKNRLKILDRK